MKSGIIFLLIGILAMSAIPDIGIANQDSRMIELRPSGPTATAPAVSVGPVADDPRRDDPLDDEIFYDDGNGQLLNIAENFWSRVSFEANLDFTLQGIRLKLFNNNDVQNPACQVYVFTENQNNNDLDDLMFEVELDDITDNEWIEIDFDENDWIDFDEDETFSIVYGPSPGGHPQEGGRGWWNNLDNSAPNTDHSYIYVGNEPSTDHDRWGAIGRDLLCRARGEYAGDIVNLAVTAVVCQDDEEEGRWTTLVGQEREIAADIINMGSTIDGFILTYLIEDADGDSVWGSDIIYEEDFEGQEEAEFIPEETWSPEEAGLYYLTVEVIPFAEDNDPDDNLLKLELIVLDPDEDPDMWATYCMTDYDWERNFYNTDSTAFATYFHHPGGDQPLKLTSFRVCLNIPDNTPQEEIPFGVFLLHLDRGWEHMWSTEVEVDETGEAVWHEIEIPEDDQVTFDNTQAIIVAWFFREVGDVQNNWIMMKHDETAPVSGTAARMPTTNRWGDDLWGTGFANAWSDGEWGIEAKFAGSIPDGAYLEIIPPELDFGFGILMDTDETITAGFYAYGSEDATVTAITGQGDVNDVLTIEDADFSIAAGETTFVDFTFNSAELINIDSRLRIQGDALNWDREQFFWPILGSTYERFLVVDDDDIRFGRDLTTFEEYTEEITFTNPSVALIEVSEIRIPEELQDLFSVDPESFEILPEESITLTITFSSPELVQIADEFVVVNTSQNDPEMVIEIEARVINLDVGNDQRPAVPEAWSLAPNHPNPFNPTTVVDFALKTGGNVELQVFNMNGNLVRNVISGYRPAGYYSVEIDASDLPAGIYIYRLNSADFSGTRKMVLLK